MSPRKQVLGLLLALLAAEALTTLIEPRAGMLLHGFLFVTLLLVAALYARGTYQKFLLALSLAPLIRLLSLTLPLAGFPFVFWYMIVGAPLFLALYTLIRLSSLGRAQLGLSLRALGWQLLIGASGILLGLIEYLILHPDPLIEQLTWSSLWLPALILLVFTGFLEELIFRGAIQYTALRKFGRFGLWYVAAVFAVLHLGYRSLLDVIFVFVVALGFGWIVIKTGSILGVTLSHGLTNVALYLVIPFLLAAPPGKSPAPQDIFAPLPYKTPFQPLSTHTPIVQPDWTPTAPVPTQAAYTETPFLPSIEESATEIPLPNPTETLYVYPSSTSLPPTPTPSETTTPPTSRPLPPSHTPTLSPTSTPVSSPTSTSVPLPSHTPENTPTVVLLSPTPSVTPTIIASSPTPSASPLPSTATNTQLPTPTPQPTEVDKATPTPTEIP